MLVGLVVFLMIVIVMVLLSMEVKVMVTLMIAVMVTELTVLYNSNLYIKVSFSSMNLQIECVLSL